jgi:hypothetical protein
VSTALDLWETRAETETAASRLKAPVRPWRVAVLVGVAITSVMLGRLFLGGVIGLGDQGDGHRLMCSLGVADAHALDENGPGWLHVRWTAHHWYGETCGADGSGEPVQSSQLWLLWPAKALTAALFGASGALDLRALGLLCSVLVGVVCAGLVLVLSGPLRLRAFVATGVGMAFADCAFAGYFVSPYSEPAALLGTAATLIALIAVWRRGHTTVPTLVCVAGAALFTIAARAQTAGYLVPVTIGVLAVPYRGILPLGWAAGGEVRARGHLLRWYGRRWPALVALALTGALAVVFVGRQPERLRDQNLYGMVFAEILPHSHDPAADLSFLGLDPAWAGASGSTLNAPGSLAGTPAYERFRDEMSWWKLGLFYGTQPSRLVGMFYRGVAATARLRPGYLGSYPVDSGQPGYTREHRVPLYSWVFAIFRWANWLMVAEWIMLALAGLLVLRHETLPARSKVYGHLSLWLALAIPAHFWTESMTEGGVETTRHLTCVAFLTAIGLPVLAVCSSLLLTALRSSPGISPPAPGRTARGFRQRWVRASRYGESPGATGNRRPW